MISVLNSLFCTQDESDTARDLKNMLVTLKFQKPPDNISPEMLFSKLESKLQEVLKTVPSEHLGKPLIDVELSVNQWKELGELQEELHKEYTIRRDTLLKRLDVTVQSFLVEFFTDIHVTFIHIQLYTRVK